MFSRISTLTIVALVAYAAAAKTNTTVTGGKCNSGSLQCCNPAARPVQSALGVLNIPIGTITADVGLTCDPITVRRSGDHAVCLTSLLAADNNNYNGVVALGCTPVNLGV
ncbi:hydrophobin 2 [Armillaria novae-zelandiae]|uniref:Hydrophobin n=1 Tax=Armillaria novae-zelandiae TaxID=153914 RepID=A0AA39U8E4_9AGAR|nr:hydrophobin 2 [Armillaria novae-zelandiae]